MAGAAARVEFTKEDVEALLTEKMKNKSSNLEERYDQMVDYIKRLRSCIKWFQELEGKYLEEQEKFQAMLNVVEGRCNEPELFMKKNEEELNATVIELGRKYAEAQEELLKYQGKLQASNQKISYLEGMKKGLQECNTCLEQYNTTLQNELAANNDNLKRIEKEKAEVVQHLNIAISHNKSLLDELASSSRGLWSGMIADTFAQTAILLWIILRTSWTKEVETAKKRLAKWEIPQEQS